ncbi:MAG: sodium/bile acid cotransporter 7 [Pirellulaceae bacterium]
MKQFFKQRWFLIALAVVLAVGIIWSPQLEFLANLKMLRYAIVSAVLFLMAFPLEASAIASTISRPAAALLACVINFGFIPPLAFLLSQILQVEMGAGLMVAATTPCTLASAAVWTRRAGGNDSISLLVTLITNGLCFVITPAWLYLLTGINSDVISPVEMISKLGVLVVLPMALAQLLRIYGPLGKWATKNKLPMSFVAQCGILSMVFTGAIRTGLNIYSGDSPAWYDWCMMITAVVIVHLAALWTGFSLARMIGFTKPDCIAIGISGSQKTLMVGLQVALESGLSALPIVCYHVGQLILDTLIADRWKRESETED